MFYVSYLPKLSISIIYNIYLRILFLHSRHYGDKSMRFAVGSWYREAERGHHGMMGCGEGKNAVL